MDARLFDVTGSRHGQPPVTRQSVITTTFKLILDDAFARRVLTPHQQLHFDEVIPAETRIDDIKMALRNLGFTVTDPWPDQGPERRWLWAERAEGPDKLRIMLDAWKASNTSHSGDGRSPAVLPIAPTSTAVRCGSTRHGSLARNSYPVVREMNALRETLRERFERPLCLSVNDCQRPANGDQVQASRT